MREALDDRFCICSASEPFHPVFTLIKRAEDRGSAVKAALCQFQKKLDISLGQLWHQPFVQNQYLENCILVKHLVLAAGKQ